VVKLYVEEEEGRELVRAAVGEAGRVATSTVAYAEARAALARKEREGELDRGQHLRALGALDAEWRGFVRMPVSNLVAYRAGEMAERYALWGFDAIHLASAVRLGERFDDLSFLAFDDRLVEAARGASVLVYKEG
jgi:uncharacterized protein